MPFDFRTYLEMFGLAFRDRPSPGRFALLCILFVLFPVISAVNSLCLCLDRLVYPGFRRTQVTTPVFIVGQPRSGTTLMHKLACGDSERFTYFMMYELFLPSIVQKKLVRLLGRLDRRFLGGSIARRIGAWEDRTFAKGRQMHPMGLTNPEEDEFLMMPCCASSTLAMVFPYQRELNRLHYFDERPPSVRRRIMRYYRGCVQRQIYLNGNDRILCSKNPVFVPKLRSLLETFPDAKFIVMVRTPYETIPSILKMMERNWRATGCDRQRIGESLRLLGEQCFHTYRYPFEILETRPPETFAIVSYTDLVASPTRVFEDVYARLGFEMSPAFATFLANEEAKSKEHRSEHVYALREYGLTREQIRSNLADLFQRFGWDEEDAAQVATHERR
jgi:hypothetical protein